MRPATSTAAGLTSTTPERQSPSTIPATGEIIGTVPKLGRPETRDAIAAADRALPAWRGLTAKERAVTLRRWFDLIMTNQEDLARLMTLEQGKPLVESRGEVAYGAAFIEWFAEEGKRAYGDTIPSHARDKRIIVIKQPIGVVGCITPWNFPIAMITRKVGPALAAGCTVVAKPASQTPFSALALAALAERAGIPAGVFNVVTGSATESLADPLETHFDPEPSDVARFLDWDRVARGRYAAAGRLLTRRPHFPFRHPHFSNGVRMRILVINNDGGGFADYVEVEAGTTVASSSSGK